MHEFVDLSVRGGNSVARKGRLVISLTEEVGEDERGENGGLESDGSEEDTGEDHKLGISHHFHGGIKVLCKVMLADKLVTIDIMLSHFWSTLATSSQQGGV